jgi:hypothetical protein
MQSNVYKVLWTIYARVELARMREYKVDARRVFTRSKALLANDPLVKADGVSDFVDACYFANTGVSHYIFWGIDPDEE